MAYTYKYGSYMSTSGAKNFIRPYIYYQITNTAEQTTIKWWAGCNIKSNYSTNAKITMKTTCTDRAAMSSTVDNKGWGGGSHAMVNNTYTWTRGTANASKTLTAKMSTNVDSSTVSLTFTISARGKVTVTFDTDGGSAVAAQSIFYNTSTALTSAVPEKANYEFLGWATESGGQVVYPVGAANTIKSTTNVTLFAIWKQLFVDPVLVGDAKAYRVDSRQTIKGPALVNDGTIAYFEFTTDKGLNVDDYLSSYQYYVDGSTTSLSASLYLDDSDSSYNVYYGYLGVTDSFDKDYSYDISLDLTVTDLDGGGHVISVGSFISAEVYEIDISADGKRVSFGHLASDNADPLNPRTDFAIEVNGDIYLKKELLELKDFIFEEGTDGNWTYRKWYSGKCEAWYSENINQQYNFNTRPSSTAYYYTNADWINHAVALPAGLFDTVEAAMCNITNNGYITFNVPSFTTSSVNIRAFTNYAAAPRLTNLSIYVVGTYA